MQRGPKLIGSVLNELMVHKGFAGVRRAEGLEAAWRDAVGEDIARHTRVGSVRRGKLEVTVAHSTIVQELTFRKNTVLTALRESLPQEAIHDLHLRVGPIV